MTHETTKTELAAVLDTMVDGVIIISGKGIIEGYNPACEKIFGHAKPDVIGKNIKILMPEPYHSEHDGYIENYAETGNAKIIGIGRDVTGRRKDGSTFPMYLSVGELPRASERAFVGIIRDLTSESQQQKKYDTLQLEHFHLSRVAAMDQMGAAIAHELNQPLSAVMNYLEAGSAILEQGQEGSEAILKDIMSKSAVQADRASKILSNLRRFIETGDVEKSIHDLSDLIATAIDLIRPSFNNDSIALHLEIPKDLPQVLISGLQIQQVLVNLLRNAVEALADGREKHLWVTAELDKTDFVKVGVIDTGLGMTDEQFKRLYEPFASNKAGGLGVGLSISQSIIANHDGRLWAERNSPQGTRFYFTVPAIEARKLS